MRESHQDMRRMAQKLRPSSGVILGSVGKTSENKIRKTDKEKLENEEILEKTSQKKTIPSNTTKSPRKPDRDLRRFKVRYNTGIGNIMRNWMSLMYSILILRMNLIKFIFEHFPDMHGKNRQLSQQILLECKVIYHMIRKAQHFSQERALFLWNNLEKLVLNRSLLKNYLEMMRKREMTCRDWKGMAARLELMQAEYDKVQSMFNSVKAEKSEREKALTNKMHGLENLSRSKDELLEQLIDQIMHLKKVELEASCQIINHLKTYRDLSIRKKELLNTEKELKQLKNEQEHMMREFTSKVKALKFSIVEKESEIKAEKEEKKKLKKALKEFGSLEAKNDYSYGNEAAA